MASVDLLLQNTDAHTHVILTSWYPYGLTQWWTLTLSINTQTSHSSEKQSQSPDSAVTSQLDQSRAHDDDVIVCSRISSFTYIVTAAGTSQNNSDIGRALTVCTYIIHK